MKNQSSEWVFVKKASRPALSGKKVQYWKGALQRLLKAGIEIELNLPVQTGRCDRQNFLCKCTNVFNASAPMPSTSLCYEQCAHWDGGNCSIAKEEGCVGTYCAAFKSPCPHCSKFDRGCDTCPELYDINKDPRKIRELVGKALAPTRFVGATGKTGTYKVCRDGSLLGDGGIEVATTGRRVQFAPIYDMMRNIIDECTKYGAYTNYRCSIHNHMLASYLTPAFGSDDIATKYIKNEITELEGPLPEIIVANFHQLVRRYQCALVWMSAAGKSMTALTRWEKFRKSILPYSVLRNKMPLVVKEVGSASSSKRKYGLINYEQMVFDQLGRASRFHIEGRYMDGCLSPAAITAHTCLLFALVVKAVEISRHGVLQSGNREYMQRQREIYDNLCNNDASWGSDIANHRQSDTSRLEPYIPDLIEQSMQLVRLVKNTLSEMTPADAILRELAEMPIALRLIRGDSWEKIEDDLMPGRHAPHEHEDRFLRIASLGAISECESSDEWVDALTNELARETGASTSAERTEELRVSLRSLAAQLTARQRISWSQDIGGYLVA